MWAGKYIILKKIFRALFISAWPWPRFARLRSGFVQLTNHILVLQTLFLLANVAYFVVLDKVSESIAFSTKH